MEVIALSGVWNFMCLRPTWEVSFGTKTDDLYASNCIGHVHVCYTYMQFNGCRALLSLVLIAYSRCQWWWWRPRAGHFVFSKSHNHKYYTMCPSNRKAVQTTMNRKLYVRLWCYRRNRHSELLYNQQRCSAIIAFPLSIYARKQLHKNVDKGRLSARARSQILCLHFGNAQKVVNEADTNN